jgi:indole-3-acetate monooxygenase
MRRIKVGGVAPASLTPQERRLDLFARVDSIADELRAGVADGENLAHLSDGVVDAMRRVGLIALKVPLSFGGFEAEPALQFEVFERIARLNPCASWCLFIYADVLGLACAHLPEASFDAMVAADPLPMICGGGGLRPAILEPVEGGYRLNAKSRYGSGMHHAGWVTIVGLLFAPDGPPEPRYAFVPKDQVQTDPASWDMFGMRATGSIDYAFDNVFVPEAFAGSALSLHPNAGRMYRTGPIGYLAQSIPAVAFGIVGAALDRLVADSARISRGYAKPTPLGDWQVFQRFLGEATQRLRAARALMITDGEELMAAVDRGDDLTQLEAAGRSAGAWATHVALEVMTDIARHPGGSILRQGSPYERALRDVTVVATHFLVDEASHETLGRYLLGHEGLDPMA